MIELDASFPAQATALYDTTCALRRTDGRTDLLMLVKEFLHRFLSFKVLRLVSRDLVLQTTLQ